MGNDILLKQIGELIDSKLEPIRKELGSINTRFNTLAQDIQEVKQAIVKSQQEAIEAVSELVHSGYSMHEKRITRIEDHLDLTPLQE